MRHDATHRAVRCLVRAFAACALLFAGAAWAQSGEPIKIGYGISQTGGLAPNGKGALLAMQIAEEDINARGGLLGRPVKLVYYDDQTSPANVPALYTKLLDVDKVDLVIGPYATNMVAPAMPIIMAHNKMTISILGLNVNSQFHYPRYFSTVPLGPEGPPAYSRGFFEVAKAQSPRPETVALIAADAEFAKTSVDGARANAKAAGFKIVYDGTYPPNNTDFLPIMRAVQAANPDVVFAAAYPPDTVGIIRAAHEIGLSPKMFGGSLIGLYVTPIKMQLGPIVNGIVINQSFLAALQFPGTAELMKKYQAIAPEKKVDPLGYAFVPFAYAVGQLVATAVEATQSLDDDKLAKYLHAHTVDTVIGPLSFLPDGEWTKPRILITQFQHVDGNDLHQFDDPKKEVILWPPEYANGKLIYPYGDAKT